MEETIEEYKNKMTNKTLWNNIEIYPVYDNHVTLNINYYKVYNWKTEYRLDFDDALF